MPRATSNDSPRLWRWEAQSTWTAPRAVALAAVFYALRQLLPPDTPTNDGLMRDVDVLTRPGSLVDARYPAPVAAGKIHSDFERGFIRAEVMAYEAVEEYKSEAAVKAAGKLRLEGKEYVVVDGDVMHFRFNV